MKNKFIVVTHAVLSDTRDVAGPAHNIVSYLDKKGQDYLFIRHSLFKGDKTLVHIKKNGKSKELEVESYVGFGEIINRLHEGIQTIRIVNKYMGNEKTVFIGIDPLNSLWGLFLKITRKTNNLISFTVDYSPKRFENYILNSVYHFIDKITLKYSDQAWVVSSRIFDLRITQGKDANKLFLVPNAPAVREIKKLINKDPNPYNLITVGTISKALDFSMIIEALGSLVKKYPMLKLTIIGQGDGMDDLIASIEDKKLTKNVILAGLKTHKEVFEILSEQGIGIAIYTDNASWSYYSDSMKARDYLALGLPVIISGNIGTAAEIKSNNAGINVKKDKKDLASAIEKLISDKDFYKKLRENALKMSDETDIEKTLDNAFKKGDFL